MSENVLADAQFGIARLLRPFTSPTSFATVYEGQSCLKPIQFTEGGVALADGAATGADGIDPKLLRGVDVPFGSNIQLLLPAIIPAPLWTSTSTQSVGFYRYVLVWRFRNIAEYRSDPAKTNGYHVGKQAVGAPDVGAKRFLKIAAFSSSSYASAEPGTPSSTSTIEAAYPLARVDDTIQTIRVDASSQNEGAFVFPYVPLLPDGSSGRYQQGVISTTYSMNKYTPSWILHNTCAMGDELLIGMFRDAPSDNRDTTVNLWKFSDFPDIDFYNFINDSADNGIYLFTGTRP